MLWLYFGFWEEAWNAVMKVLSVGKPTQRIAADRCVFTTEDVVYESWCWYIVS